MAKNSVSGSIDDRPPERIDVKQAARRAREYLLDLYEDEDLPNLRLEEVELSEDGAYWLITMGFTGAEKRLNTARS